MLRYAFRKVTEGWQF